MPTSSRTRVALAHAALLLAALLYGATFVFVKEAMELSPPHSFLGWRFLLGTLALLLLGLSPGLPGRGLPRGRRLWRDGSIAGLLLFAGYALQTVGLIHTSASHSALITGLYVVVTPLLAAVLARRRVRMPVLLGAVITFVGLAILAAPSELHFARGDLLTVGCAILFAAHVIALARASSSHSAIPYTVVQLLVVTVLSFAVAVATEDLTLPSLELIPAFVITGLGASAVAFLAQVWAQATVGPSRTVMILSLETVFGALLGWWLLGERLGKLGLLGGALILAGIQVVLMVTLHDEDLPAAEAITPAH